MANQVQAPRVTVIDPIVPEKAKLRVAAYARVSSDSADQLNSYLAQVDYYTRHIGENPDWDLVDIYADEGISGLDARKRDEFNRMLADCRAGKIDRILVKSVSRFARNTRDTLRFMRELLRLGITIQFEKENIDTGRLSTEQVAAIYAAFAQMESTNHSGTMRTSVRMRMEQGIFTPSSMPYGYRLNGLEPEIVPEEAEVVRHIFSSALRGYGRKNIAQELNELGIERGHGRKVWNHTTISYILTNSFYTGGSVWQKFCTTDTIPFQKVKNKGQQPKYLVEDDHPGIISRKDFQRVQELIVQRREQYYDGAAPSQSPYIGKIYCGQCESKFRRKVCEDKVYWDCYRHNAGKERCPSHQIPETALTAALLRLHNKLALHRTTGCANRIGELKSNCQKHFYRRVTVNKQITSGFSKGASYTRGCKCAYPTDEFHGWGCKITGDHCMFLFPDSKSCATRYGEGPDADASCDSAESSS